jgi:hypothetical protein
MVLHLTLYAENLGREDRRRQDSVTFMLHKSIAIEGTRSAGLCTGAFLTFSAYPPPSLRGFSLSCTNHSD